MRIEILAIGTELLTTRHQDTNSTWISERLAARGLRLARKTCLGDDPEDLRAAFREALGRSELVICTGGLGPTFDDQTKEVWAEVLGEPLREDPDVWRDIQAFHAERQRTVPASNRKQALVPCGATVLSNPVGTAPGLLWETSGDPRRPRVVLLPGVPAEMMRMFQDQVEPRLGAGEPLYTLRVVVAGVPESRLEERLRPVRERHAHLDWTILASPLQAELLARSTDPSALEPAYCDLAEMLGADLVLRGAGNLEDALLGHLVRRGETLALAESMTGGLLGARLTAIPGASGALLGGATVYSAVAKVVLAGLDPADLARWGSVSEATTLALAQAIRARLGATWGLAVTGNAGPARDALAPEVPEGAGFLAWAGPSGQGAQAFHWPGERAGVQLRAAARAMDLLRRQLA